MDKMYIQLIWYVFSGIKFGFFLLSQLGSFETNPSTARENAIKTCVLIIAFKGFSSMWIRNVITGQMSENGSEKKMNKKQEQSKIQ